MGGDGVVVEETGGAEGSGSLREVRVPPLALRAVSPARGENDGGDSRTSILPPCGGDGPQGQRGEGRVLPEFYLSHLPTHY